MQMSDLRDTPRAPFGPRQPGLRGMLLRMAQWGLLMLVVVSLVPMVMMTLGILMTALLAVIGRSPEMKEWLSDLQILLCVAALALTGLRVSGRWWRWWLFGPVALAAAALMLHSGQPKDPEGMLIQQAYWLVLALQAVLHAVWSLCERKEKGDA